MKPLYRLDRASDTEVTALARLLGVTPEITRARSLVGEVTHYVADISKARDLLDWRPTTPLEAGIPLGVGWFRAWRAAHPEQEASVLDGQVPAEGDPAFKPAAAGD